MFGTGVAIVQARVTNKTPFRRTSMSLNKASIAVALAAFLAVGGIAGQALAAPHDGHDGHWRQQRSYQDCIYQALTQEKKAQYDAIMKEFADKTAPLRDKLAAKYIELRTLGNSPTPDPKAIGKATEELVALRNEFAKERSAMVDRVAKEIGINIFQDKGPGCPVERPRRCPATGMTVMPDGPQPGADAPASE